MITTHEQQLSPEFDCEPAEHTSTLVIASTGRSGSHMLGRTLRQTGVFGFPLEYLHRDNFRQWGRITGQTRPLEILRAIIRRRTSPNGVFGIKLHYSQLVGFGDTATLLGTLVNPFFVHLTRGDVVAQAVSYSIAVQTGQWASEQQPRSPDATYNAALINRCLREILADNAGWQHFLAASGFDWMPLQFEVVSADPVASILRISELSGVELPQVVPIELATRKQGGSLNAEWAERFRREHPREPELFLARNDLLRYLFRGVRRRLLR
jgi:LPS sulfotransferase NodH